LFTPYLLVYTMLGDRSKKLWTNFLGTAIEVQRNLPLHDNATQ